MSISIKLAAIYAGLGDKDEAFRLLEKGYEQHSATMPCLGIDVFWYGMHRQQVQEIVKWRSGTLCFRSPTFPFLGRRTEEYGLSDRQSTDASDRAVDSRVVLVRTNDRLQHFWRRTC